MLKIKDDRAEMRLGDGGKGRESTPSLAVSITRASSRQTSHTIRFLADSDRAAEAFKAYAYFRWVDDRLDDDASQKSERLAFVARQKELMECCYHRNVPCDVTDEERMLCDLVKGDVEKHSGLELYIRNMMMVMAFDAERRGRLISQRELDMYSQWLAVAVTEALHYFIGHNHASPRGKDRYLAVTGAHITHMLRDTLDDARAGYFNIPAEFINLHGLDPLDVESVHYIKWVRKRVEQARACFQAGKQYLAQVENRRCRFAGFAYTDHFESVLDAIERDGCRLRPGYPECDSVWSAIRMGWSALLFSLHPHKVAGMSATPIL